jgi:hypothetical protein
MIDEEGSDGSIATCPCTEFELEWNLENASEAVASKANGEVTVRGDFGSIEFSHKEKHKGTKSQTYYAKALNFKSPSEHKLSGVHTDGEV